MKRFYILLCLLFSIKISFAQLLTWNPEFPVDNGPVTIVLDATKGNAGLNNFEGGNSQNVYVHIGLITSASTNASDWRFVPFAWGSSTPAAKATPLGNNKYSYTISNIRAFFAVPAGETILKIAVIFRNASGSLKAVNSDGSDMFVPVYAAGAFRARLNLPAREPRYTPVPENSTWAVGNTVNISGVSSQAANLTIRYNGQIIATANNSTNITASQVITTACDQQIILEAVSGNNTAADTISLFVPAANNVVPLPAGVVDGINYSAINTEVTLVLFAPDKTSASVTGDFNNWTAGCSGQMTRTPDGKRYWIKLSGLTPGKVYGFQYIVDGNIRIADPYTELVLDPANDSHIPAGTFPNLPAYPAGLTSGIVSTFQTAAPAYNWSGNTYTRPDKKQLVIYELLLRDFLANANWQTLTDTLNYIKNLGVNAIELMPFTEFDGNSSWGYNPSFFFAPDKIYGTKNNLKRFIDSAHSKGMAVIMDAVFNHATGNSPLAQLYWNSAANQPAANSPYFNAAATHPFSVFNDFNHSTEATKYLTSRFIRHWLTEYKLDGFRWDLSKGFTQKQCADVNCWNQYDATRVAIWQRYMDSSQAVNAGAYMILEHLGNDDEESDLANRGFLLWGNMNAPYNQNTMGYVSNSDISRTYFANRTGWTVPHLIGYAESHDEERIMYKNLAFGNSSNPAHDVKSLEVALKRTEAMQALLLLIPGPKMIWQFGELGYDKSIFSCTDGTVPAPYGTDNCKLAPKPVLWSYNANVNRKKIYNTVAKMNHLRRMYPGVFTSATVSGTLGNDLKKILILNHADAKIVAAANFDVTPQNFTINFPAAGIWNEYLDGSSLSLQNNVHNISLQPGEYHVWIAASCTAAAPTNVSVSNPGNTNATITWSSAATAFTVEYRPSGSGAWMVAANNIAQTSYLLQNLAPNSSYEVRITALCPGSNPAAGAATIAFQTTGNITTESGISLTVAPNPASTHARVDIRSTQTGPLNITIFDSEGKRVKNLGGINFTGGILRYDISGLLRDISAGIYLLKVEIGNQSNSVRIKKH